MAIELTDKMSGIDFQKQVSKALDKTGDTMTGALIPRTVTQPSDYTEDEVVPYSVVKSTTNTEANKTKADIYADIYKVGNILSTVRTDLDDTWLLCNGDVLDQYKYEDEDLFRLYLNNALSREDIDNSNLGYPRKYAGVTPGSNYTYTQLTRIEGNWILLGYYRSSSNTPSSPYLFYREDLSEGEWKSVRLQEETSNVESDNIPKKIVHNGEYWVVMTGMYLYYSKSLDGEWTRVDLDEYISGSYRAPRLYDITYEEGTWVVVGSVVRSTATHYAAFWYTDDLSLNSWIFGGSGTVRGHIESIARVGSNWVVTGSFELYKASTTPAPSVPGVSYPSSQSSGSYYFSAYAYSEDLSKSVSEWYYVLEYGGISVSIVSNKLFYINDTLIKYKDDNSTCYYTTNFEDVKTDNSRWSTLGVTVDKITYTQGFWVALSASGILYVTDNLGEWTQVDKLSTGGYVACTMSNLIVDGGYIYAHPYQSGNVHYASHPLGDFKLPNISLNGVHTYIKAKEQQKKEE